MTEHDTAHTEPERLQPPEMAEVGASRMVNGHEFVLVESCYDIADETVTLKFVRRAKLVRDLAPWLT